MNYFLDTNICVYFLKGLYPSIKENFGALLPQNIKVASIVKAELLFGVENSIHKKKNLELIEKFLLPFEVIPFDDKATSIYSKIRYDLTKKGNIIGPNDLILASIVLANEGILVTNNLNEFSRIKNLRVENWVT